MMRTFGLLLIVLLGGCAAQAAGPAASVDINALVKAHPLYGTLAQYDRQIAVLRNSLHAPAFAYRNQAFINAARGVGDTLDRAAARAKAIEAMPSPDVRSLQESGNVSAPSESQVRSDMQQTYAQQSSQLQAAAQRDMERYRATLLAQQDTAFANYVRAVQARVQQAYNARKQELYEKESTLALDLAKADAGQRLSIRTKLQTLRLDSDRRHALLAQLAAIQAREDAVVAKQRARDRTILAAFVPPLQARADADIARMRGDLQRRTAANLAARERVLAAQRASAMRLNLGAPAGVSNNANTGGDLNAVLAARPADPGAFTAARDDLARHFANVRGADDSATRSTYAQIADLQHVRAQLYTDIISQIMRDAALVARTRGLSRVYTEQQAPPGSTDITPNVRSDIANMAR
jgi:hypothetical protein